MQFKVPQFIDIEDKLFGPLTFFQFIYLAGGAGMAFVVYKLLPLWLAFIPILLILGLALMMTFYRINNKPFVYYLQAGVAYAFGSKLYIWKQRLVKPSDVPAEEDVPQKTSIVPMMSKNSQRSIVEFGYSGK